MQGPKPTTVFMVMVSVVLHALAIVWLSVPEPAAHEPDEVGILVAMAPPAAEPEPVSEPEPEAVEAVDTPAAESPPVAKPEPIALPATAAIPILDEIEPRMVRPTTDEVTATATVLHSAVVDPAVAQTYEAKLVAWLARFKHYPKLALRRGAEGECVLRVLIDRGGHVVSCVLQDSSGNDLLDGEALAMVERANPFPAPPDEIAGQTLEYVIPVTFELQ